MNVPKLRFKEFTDEWKTHKLKDFFSKITKKNKSNSIHNVISNSAKFGLVKQIDYFSKDIANTDNTEGYFIIEKNDFVYNPRKSLEAPFGPICKYNYNETGIVSPLYLCFRCSQLINYDFFEYLFKSSVWYKYIYQNGDSGARHDRVNIKDSTFFLMPIFIPQSKEQEKIAKFLTTVDKKITNLENIITSLENQKKGLLQQIFSQKLRFKDKNGNNYPNWEKKKLGDIATLKNGISKSNEAFGHGKKFINLQDIFNKSYIFNDNYSLVDVTEKELSENNLLKGDVLFVCSSVKREGVGLPCVIMENLIDTVYSGFIIRCRFNINENIYLHYKKYCFLEFSFRKALLKKSSSSANTNINQDNLSKLYVNLPCLEEQTKIADFLSAFDRKLDNQKAQLEHWKQIKKGLLQQMFV